VRRLVYYYYLWWHLPFLVYSHEEPLHREIERVGVKKRRRRRVCLVIMKLIKL
jgi:hypothetical protein